VLCAAPSSASNRSADGMEQAVLLYEDHHPVLYNVCFHTLTGRATVCALCFWSGARAQAEAANCRGRCCCTSIISQTCTWQLLGFTPCLAAFISFFTHTDCWRNTIQFPSPNHPCLFCFILAALVSATETPFFLEELIGFSHRRGQGGGSTRWAS